MADPIIRIGGKVATAEERAQFLAELEESSGLSTAKLATDNNITKKDLQKFIDVDHDGHATFRDLQKISASGHPVWNLTNTLGRYLNLLRNDKSLTDDITKFVDPVTKKDLPAVLDAVTHNVDMLEFLPVATLNDPQKFLTLLRDTDPQQRFILLHTALPERVRSDPKFALAALQLEPNALMFFSRSLVNNPEFMRQAIDQNPQCMRRLGYQCDTVEIWSYAFQKDPTLIQCVGGNLAFEADAILPEMIAVIREHPDLVLTIHPKLEGGDYNAKILPALWEAAVRAKPELIQQAPQRICEWLCREIPALAMTPIALAQRYYQDWRGLQPTDNAERKQLGLRELTTTEQEKLELGTMPQAQRTQVWQEIVKRLQNEHVTFPFPVDTFEHFIAGCRANGIDFPERFHRLDSIAKILADRTPQLGDTRPVTLALYPKADWNGAFQCTDTLDVLVQNGLRVVYTESADTTDDIKYIQHATENGTREVDHVIFAGHGSRTTLERSARDNLDEGDLKGPLGTLLKRVAKKQVMHISCDNGEGGADGDNLLRDEKRTLRPGVHVTGFQVHANVYQIWYDATDGLLHMVPTVNGIPDKNYLYDSQASLQGGAWYLGQPHDGIDPMAAYLRSTSI